ncbi:GTPase [Methanocaldococcus indicus]|uniref:GTPase n=1 Tax=Methanocaldococcus indicus TaxID=213231 RepID=UPI003C6D48DF
MRKKVNVKKIVNKVVDESDLILFVLDARDPELTRNRELEKIIKDKGKKIIYVLNKADLVPKAILERWKKNFDDDVVYISAKNRLGTKILRNKIKEKLRGKGKVGIVGYPNVGKSSIINALTGKRKALTGYLAGLTKGEQWINLTKNIKLLDTPGVIEMKDEDDLIISGALRLEKADSLISPAIKILKRIDKFDNTIIKDYYNINYNEVDEDILKKIAEVKKFYKVGGELDIERAAKSVIKDFQEGKLNYYKNIKIKKFGQDREKDISFITKHLKDFLFIDDAKMIVEHLKEKDDLYKKIKKPVVGLDKIDDNIILISFGEKTKDAGRKKIENLAKNKNIELHSIYGDKIGKNVIFVGVGKLKDNGKE